MLLNRIFFGVVCIILTNFSTQAQKINPDDIWPASWIRAVSGPQKDFGVFHFRHKFELAQIPDSLFIYTSGDNRYKLYINGQLVTWGPLRGDIEHWYYETTDIAPFLKEGENTLAAVVWNYGANPPDAQFSVTTAFVLCAVDKKFKALNTNKTWKAAFNPGVLENPVDKAQIGGYYGAGSKEKIDGTQYLWGWEKADYDDTSWKIAFEIESPKPKKCIWAGRWKLMPREIPMEQLNLQRIPKVRLAEGVDIPENFPKEPRDFTVAANSKARFVLDQTFLTTAYPELEISQGKGAKIIFKYSEAPTKGKLKDRDKGNRNEIEGKTFYGYHDEFISGGGSHRVFSPLWWRAFRYIEVTIETQKEPLTIHDIRGIFTAYPFEKQATFEVEGENLPISNENIQKMLEIGNRTTQLCAHETLMDCPYYEETQFVGDSRIEALVGYANFGDSKLGKNAIEQFSWSVNSEGFLSARYPANSTYYIPNFSLIWIGMLYDYMMYFNDPAFIRAKLPVSRIILNSFFKRTREDGSVHYPEYHNFVDWTFKKGEAPVDAQGYSALVDLHFLLALQWARALEEEIGEHYFVQQYDDQIAKLQTLIREKYWVKEKGLFADTSEKIGFSQHTNCLSIITKVVTKETAKEIIQKVLTGNEEMTKATLYWRFYVSEALHTAGWGSDYLKHLDIWEEAMEAGVTTWPETGLKSRSECHGWGASPNYHFLKLIAGITPGSSGFNIIRIAPSLDKITSLNIEMPHHSGLIKIDLTKEGNDLKGDIEIPEGAKGIFIWKGEEITFEKTLKL
ncbi:MAG: alpha-L-rhamnosidase N-terminal domain-containing protein [Bacteroidota bacterium]